jgi:hypothetical protein
MSSRSSGLHSDVFQVKGGFACGVATKVAFHGVQGEIDAGRESARGGHVAGVGESRSALHLDAAKRTGKIVVGPVKSGGGLSGQ